MDRRDVERAVADALVEKGYRRALRERHIFLKPIGDSVKDDVSGWVSYTMLGTEYGEVDVTPSIGVRHVRIHELIDRCKATESYPAPTASIILGYLMAENSANLVWRFGPKTPLDEQARSLAGAVVRYGEPWMRRHSSSQAIIEQLRAAQRGTRPSYPERLPAALLVVGCPEEAQAALDAELSKLEARTDAAAETLREFAARFRAELAQRNWAGGRPNSPCRDESPPA